jgi:hypothetical protein
MELQFDPERNHVRIVMTGALSREAIRAAFDAAVADERYRAGMARLWDFRAADPATLDSETVVELGRYSLRFPPGINDVKVAIVSGSELGFGLSRMFEMTSQAKTRLGIFRDLAAAEDWLAEES